MYTVLAKLTHEGKVVGVMAENTSNGYKFFVSKAALFSYKFTNVDIDKSARIHVKANERIPTMTCIEAKALFDTDCINK